MEETTSQILRSGTVAVAVAAFVFTFFVRRILETRWPHLMKSQNGNEPPYRTSLAMWWNKVILYLLPVLFGAATAFIDSDFLHGSIKDFGGRLLFQGGVGWFSSFLYKILKQVIQSKLGVDIQDGSIAPPPMSGK